jgi:hypothetical protein
MKEAILQVIKEKKSVLKNAIDPRADGLQKTMNCARWIVQEFQSLHCAGIARIFQRAVDDADSWIQTMAVRGQLPSESSEPIKAKEAAVIHNILIKYASIDDPAMRKIILGKMMATIEENES